MDELDREIIHGLVVRMKEEHELIDPGVHILLLSRHIERLADHATNIAEDVIFLVEARIVKHSCRCGDTESGVG